MIAKLYLTFGIDQSSVHAEMRYSTWGSVRYSSGTTPTDFTYTGQRSETESFGLMFYNARWYDPYLKRMGQPDSNIPNVGNPKAWDRYAYVLNNPIRYVDPTGKYSEKPTIDGVCTVETCIENPDLFPQIIYVTTATSTPVPPTTLSDESQESEGIPLPPPTPDQSTFPTPIAPSIFTPDLPTDSEIIVVFGNQVYIISVEYLEYISRAYPIYQHVKGIIPATAIEGILSAGFQLVADADGNYDPGQRAGRAIIAGVEGAITDIASNKVAGPIAGLLTIETGPGSAAAYVVTSFIVNEFAEFIFWPIVNDILFPDLNR